MLYLRLHAAPLRDVLLPAGEPRQSFYLSLVFRGQLGGCGIPSLESQPIGPDAVEKPTGEEVEHFLVHVAGVSGLLSGSFIIGSVAGLRPAREPSLRLPDEIPAEIGPPARFPIIIKFCTS